MLRIRRWALAMVAATTGSLLAGMPAHGAVGDLFVADDEAFGGSGGVIKVDPATGARTTISSNASATGPAFVGPEGIALEPDGDILVGDYDAFAGIGGGVIRIDPATGTRTAVSENAAPTGGPSFVDPSGLEPDFAGRIVVADPSAFGGTGGVIRVDPATGVRTTVSENSAPAGGPSFESPLDVAIEADGHILVVDVDAFGGTGGVIRVDPVTGARTTVSENASPAGGPSFDNPLRLALEVDGDILVADEDAFGGTGGVIRVDPVTGARTTVTSNATGGPALADPFGIAVEQSGQIVVADSDAFGGSGGVLRVDPVSGARTTVSENAAPSGAPSFDSPAAIVAEFGPVVPPPPPDKTAPETEIDKGPKKKTQKRKAKFTFSANEAGAKFECNLDGNLGFSPCSSPVTVKVGLGKHSFTVRAIDAAGNVDATPDKQKWRVRKPKRRD